MKLTYNNLKLHQLFQHLRCVGESVRGDPEQNPKRWRKTITYEGDVNQETFQDNRGLIDNIRAAFNVQKGLLVWAADNDVDFLRRAVDIVEHNLPADHEELQRGTFWQRLRFTVGYWDNAVTSNTLGCTFKRTGALAGDAPLDLGDVDEFDDGYTTELMNRMRNQRSYVGGRCSLRGRIKADTTDPNLANRRVALATKLAALKAAFKKETTGNLRYGKRTMDVNGMVTEDYLIDETVRDIRFDGRIHETQDHINYTLEAIYTRYPNESDYAVTTYKITTQKNSETGGVNLVISGRIAAPTLAVAQAKLAKLRTSVTTGGNYVLANDDGDEERIASDQNTKVFTEAGDGDGESFTELVFNDVYRKHSSGVTVWTLSSAPGDLGQQGLLRTVYSGSVTAFGNSETAAQDTARAKGDTLMLGKGDFLLNFNRNFQTHQDLAGGSVFVTMTFSAEYLERSGRAYLEVRSELVNDAFGDSVEQVSGFIQALDLSVANTLYDEIKADYSTLLLLNERRPTESYQRLRSQSGDSDERLPDRFDFSFSVYRAKGTTQISYKLESQENVTDLQAIYNLQGNIRAASQAIAEAALTALISELGLVNYIGGSKGPSKKRGRNVGGTADVDALFAYEFNLNFDQVLTGIAGLLETQVTETIQHSGDRVIEKPVWLGFSVIQKTGTAAGHRSVNVMVRATTSAACDTYVRKVRGLLIATTNENPPQIEKGYAFPRRVDGTPVGTGANVKYYEYKATFSEVIASLPF